MTATVIDIIPIESLRAIFSFQGLKKLVPFPMRYDLHRTARALKPTVGRGDSLPEARRRFELGFSQTIKFPCAFLRERMDQPCTASIARPRRVDKFGCREGGVARSPPSGTHGEAALPAYQAAERTAGPYLGPRDHLKRNEPTPLASPANGDAIQDWMRLRGTRSGPLGAPPKLA